MSWVSPRRRTLQLKLAFTAAACVPRAHCHNFHGRRFRDACGPLTTAVLDSGYVYVLSFASPLPVCARTRYVYTLTIHLLSPASEDDRIILGSCLYKWCTRPPLSENPPLIWPLHMETHRYIRACSLSIRPKSVLEQCAECLKLNSWI